MSECIKCFQERCNRRGQLDCEKHRPSMLRMCWDIFFITCGPTILMIGGFLLAERAVRSVVRDEIRIESKEHR